MDVDGVPAVFTTALLGGGTEGAAALAGAAGKLVAREGDLPRLGHGGHGADLTGAGAHRLGPPPPPSPPQTRRSLSPARQPEPAGPSRPRVLVDGGPRSPSGHGAWRWWRVSASRRASLSALPFSPMARTWAPLDGGSLELLRRHVDRRRLAHEHPGHAGGPLAEHAEEEDSPPRRRPFWLAPGGILHLGKDGITRWSASQEAQLRETSVPRRARPRAPHPPRGIALARVHVHANPGRRRLLLSRLRALLSRRLNLQRHGELLLERLDHHLVRLVRREDLASLTGDLRSRALEAASP